MKKLRLAGVGLMSLLAFTACNDDDDDISVNGNATAVANNLKSGTWRITEFVEDGVDRLSEFESYAFTFGANGQLVAENELFRHTGTWSVEDDDDNDDDGFDSDIDVNIRFTTPGEFVVLTDDWDVIERTGIKVRLADDDDDSNDIDYLTFEKN